MTASMLWRLVHAAVLMACWCLQASAYSVLQCDGSCQHVRDVQAWAALQSGSQNTIVVGGDFQSTTGKWDPSKVAVNGIACRVVKQ